MKERIKKTCPVSLMVIYLTDRRLNLLDRISETLQYYRPT